MTEIVFDVITIFPEIFKDYFSYGIIKRAIDEDIIKVNVIQLRDFTEDKHRTVDDYAYGGGPGMVFKPEPIFKAVEKLKKKDSKIILTTASGYLFNHNWAKKLANESHLIIICGRYEGVDERVAKHLVDFELSVGDYVLTGGELPAMIIIDAVTRLIPGVLNKEQAPQLESFATGLLEHPHYTRPAEFRNMKVPQVLLSGNHKKILKWRMEQSVIKTLKYRPELLKDKISDPSIISILKKYLKSD